MRYRDFFFPLKHSHNVISDIQALPACHLLKGPGKRITLSTLWSGTKAGGGCRPILPMQGAVQVTGCGMGPKDFTFSLQQGSIYTHSKWKQDHV